MKPPTVNRQAEVAKMAASGLPFGVNLPIRLLKDDAMLCFVCESGVKFFTTSAGSPAKFIAPLKAAGITAYHPVPTVETALRCARQHLRQNGQPAQIHPRFIAPNMSTVRTLLARALALPVLLVGLALLNACSPSGSSPQGSASATTPIAADQAYATVAAQGKGFTVGALMAANTVYVLFDPQCPHCSRLWEASIPLQNRIKFVWLPVAIINAKSLPQGAAMMQATNPVETMTAHERSILAGQGGIAASSSVPDEIEAAIKANTALLDRLGAESVPFIVARKPQTANRPDGDTRGRTRHPGTVPTDRAASTVSPGLQTTRFLP